MLVQKICYNFPVIVSTFMQTTEHIFIFNTFNVLIYKNVIYKISQTIISFEIIVIMYIVTSK